MANWVSAGCGVIANELAQAMEKRGQKLYGVVNRTPEKAVAFAEKYGVHSLSAESAGSWQACAVRKIHYAEFRRTGRGSAAGEGAWCGVGGSYDYLSYADL